ncbi:API5 [Branchiostoma lanceolatum]|uniref:API5 protein n=1 Tax=Branchiostoma lanceolatum TaxID=7740 RepID=A0A8K0F3Q4_BRALA|nr:API5 [Branchiostoma lanceolatum]
MASVERLYKNFGVLADAKDQATQHEAEYLEILSAVKGENNVKRLAAQFIPRFFKYFPSLSEKSLDAQLDLCEDEDSSIRRQAIKELPNFCKTNTDHLIRISDVLTQLLQTEDPSELSVVTTALIALFKVNAMGTLNGLFSQILQGEEAVRECAIKFLSNKLPLDLLTKEAEEFLLSETKKVLADVTRDEFVTFMHVLAKLQSLQTVSGRQQLVDLVVEQAELSKPFQADDSNCVDRLMDCVRQAMPLFSRNVQSTKFVAYVCVSVLPCLTSVTSSVEERDVQLEVLKLLAEMSPYCGDVDSTCLANLYTCLLEYMPVPPAEVENEENGSVQSGAEPQLQFSYVECLMFAFHQIARKTPDFLTAEDNADRLKDFRTRLQFFARGLQVYIKQLRLALQGKTGEELKTAENKIKVVALRTTSNINVLIKDLFHNPPSYKSTVGLSWKPTTKPSADSEGTKRAGSATSVQETVPAKRMASRPKHNERSLYHPPGGKYSERVGRAPTGGEFNANQWGFGQRRGGWRGRGQGLGRGQY